MEAAGVLCSLRQVCKGAQALLENEESLKPVLASMVRQEFESRHMDVGSFSIDTKLVESGDAGMNIVVSPPSPAAEAPGDTAGQGSVDTQGGHKGEAASTAETAPGQQRN